MNDRDVVERARAALEGVTPGEWSVASGAWGNVWHFPESGKPTLVVQMGDMTEADAEFIAAARELVPDLVTEVERLRMPLAQFADVNGKVPNHNRKARP